MKLRRARSILLTVILTIIMTSTSLATPYTDIEHNPHSDAILEMSRLGILAGVGNNQFAPQAELNRAAAAKVAGYLLGYTEADATIASLSESIFTDIEGTQHAWALGWINLMAQNDILKGVGNNRYAPGDSLQMVHWVAILTRILQHENEDMTWPEGYNDMANNLALDRGLYYMGTKLMNRSEMARMTTTALYNIERPDGKRIIDVVAFAQEPLDEWHIPEQNEPLFYNNANITQKLSRALVPTGGGQIITITVTATYGENNLPAAHTQIGFFANAGQADRRAQLSATEAITDANGVASVQYTTLAGDDNLQLHFLSNIYTDGAWIDRSIYAMASNTAAFISGRVINPFNGAPASNATIGIIDEKSKSYTPISVNHEGYYSSPVNVGEYSVNIELNAAQTVPYGGVYKGSHFTLSNSGDIRISLRPQKFSVGNSYTIASEMGIITGIRNRPQGSEIYILRKADNVTQIAEIGASGRFMITLPPGTYDIYNNVGTVLKGNIIIQKGNVTDVGSF